MEIIKSVLYLIGGGLILSFGAHYFVEGASRIAKTFGISSVVIGLTVVAFGTSAPEFAVNVLAAHRGNTDIAMGNVVGSNIFNTALILGACACFSSLVISEQLLKLDIPIMLGAGGLCWFFSYNGIITVFESIIFFSLIFGYTLLQVKLAMNERPEVTAEYDEAFGQASSNKLLESVKLVVSLVLLVSGAQLFVDGAVLGATIMGLSESVIALTIISAGTSLPELATSLAATFKGERDIAVGNVVGSNIFNILGVLGLSGIVAGKGLIVNNHMQDIDIPIMVILFATCLPLAFFRQRFDRWIGPVFVLVYVVYTWHLITMIE